MIQFWGPLPPHPMCETIENTGILSPAIPQVHIPKEIFREKAYLLISWQLPFARRFPAAKAWQRHDPCATTLNTISKSKFIVNRKILW